MLVNIHFGHVRVNSFRQDQLAQTIIDLGNISHNKLCIGNECEIKWYIAAKFMDNRMSAYNSHRRKFSPRKSMKFGTNVVRTIWVICSEFYKNRPSNFQFTNAFRSKFGSL